MQRFYRKYNSEEHILQISEFYDGDMNMFTLKNQIIMLRSILPVEHKENCDISKLLQHTKGLGPSMRALLSQVVLLAKLIWLLPATNAVSERSFSAL